MPTTTPNKKEERIFLLTKDARRGKMTFAALIVFEMFLFER